MSAAITFDRWAQLQQSLRPAVKSTVSVQSEPIWRVAPELARVVDVQAAPWLSEALADLRTLKDAGRNQPGFGDFRIADETMNHVRQLLTMEALRQLARPNIIRFSGGGVSLSWVLEGRELTFSVYPGDEEVTFMYTAGLGRVVADGVARRSDEVTDAVNEFLAPAPR